MTKEYITPSIKTLILPRIPLMAASTIGEGQTDGQGQGQFDASAKQGFFNFTDDEPETVGTGW